MPDAGQGDGTIQKIVGEDNVVITPSSGQGNVTVALSVDTARSDVDTSLTDLGTYWAGSEIIMGLSSGQSLTPGKMYYWSSLGQWAAADATTDGENLHAMCPDSPTDGSQMIFKGMVSANYTGTGQVGEPLYLNDSGVLSLNPSTTSGAWVRIMGYLKSTSSPAQVYLDVSNDFYQNP
jgi:hypothetical protein